MLNPVVSSRTSYISPGSYGGNQYPGNIKIIVYDLRSSFISALESDFSIKSFQSNLKASKRIGLECSTELANFYFEQLNKKGKNFNSLTHDYDKLLNEKDKSFNEQDKSLFLYKLSSLIQNLVEKGGDKEKNPILVIENQNPLIQDFIKKANKNKTIINPPYPSPPHFSSIESQGDKDKDIITTIKEAIKLINYLYESKIDKSKIDESKIDESKIDKSKIDKSKIDKSKIDKSKIDDDKLKEINSFLVKSQNKFFPQSSPNQGPQSSLNPNTPIASPLSLPPKKSSLNLQMKCLKDVLYRLGEKLYKVENDIATAEFLLKKKLNLSQGVTSPKPLPPSEQLSLEPKTPHTQSSNGSPSKSPSLGNLAPRVLQFQKDLTTSK